MRKFWFVPIRKLTAVPDEGMVTIMRDRYWLVEKGCVLFYKTGSPQCNRNKRIVDRWAKDREVVFIPVAYVPIKASEFDYCVEGLADLEVTSDETTV